MSTRQGLRHVVTRSGSGKTEHCKQVADHSFTPAVVITRSRALTMGNPTASTV
jgi:type II secretory pathway predicted ATPase ExeA